MLPDYVGPLTLHDASIRAELGKLMLQLSSSYDGRPLDADELDFVINSSKHEQMVAIRGGHVVGAASLSIVPFSYDSNGLFSEKSMTWLGSVIVDEQHRGKEPGKDTSIASQLWDEIRNWCVAKNVPTLEFMTEEDRPAAVSFYTRQGVSLVGKAWLFNVPTAPSIMNLDVAKLKAMPIVYETCKSLLDLHIIEADQPLSKELVTQHIQAAATSGIRLMQYIAPSDSIAHTSLLNAGLEPRREELIMRADFA